MLGYHPAVTAPPPRKAQPKPADSQNSSSHLPEHLRGLNPRQLEAVQHFKGPILVLAGAGSGKTRVLTRRIVHLIVGHQVRPQNILAVTFTNKATEEMRERLRHMLGERAADLWVATFHSASLRMLRRHASQLGYQGDFVVYDDQDTKGVLKQVLKECDIDEKKYPVTKFSRAIDNAKNAVILPEDYLSWALKGQVSESKASSSDSSSSGGSSWKGGGFHQKGGRGNPDDDFDVRLEAEVYGFYQKALRRANAMDFGDLVMNAVLLLEGCPDVLRLYQQSLQFILVDEFQDTNEAQYRLIRLLTKTQRNLLVVGDDDQSIYAFRGASIRNILEFEQDFPDTKVVTLDQNYRSSSNILEAAYHVIQHNTGRKEKKLWSEAPPGEPLKLFVGADEGEEARFVAQEVAELEASGLRLDSMAVFYRTNAQSRALEEAFMAAGIPYRIFGGLKFYDRKEIKDILAYLRLLVNPSDDQAFLRTINTPPRGIGAQTVQNIQARASEGSTSLLQAAKEFSAKNKNVRAYVELIEKLRARANEVFLSHLIHQTIEESQYRAKLKEQHDATAESRLENLAELEAIGRSADQLGSTPAETLRLFLDRVSLTSSADLPGEQAREGSAAPIDTRKSVSFMTLHLAKGLEFPVAFLTGVEEGLLPHYRALYNASELEEERRLCYVGITRAMQKLYLTRALTRGMFASSDGGGGLYRYPSRFLDDIPSGITEMSTLISEPIIDESSRDEIYEDDNW